MALEKPFNLRRVQEAVAGLASALKTGRDLTVVVTQDRAPIVTKPAAKTATITNLAAVDDKGREYRAEGFGLDVFRKQSSELEFVPPVGAPIAATMSDETANSAKVLLAKDPTPGTTYAVLFKSKAGFKRPTGLRVSIPRKEPVVVAAPRPAARPTPSPAKRPKPYSAKSSPSKPSTGRPGHKLDGGIVHGRHGQG
jgi:hypothetical protein